MKLVLLSLLLCLSLVLSSCSIGQQPPFKGTYISLQTCKTDSNSVYCAQASTTIDLAVLGPTPSKDYLDTVITMKDGSFQAFFQLQDGQIIYWTRQKQTWDYHARDIFTGEEFELTLVYSGNDLLSLNLRKWRSMYPVYTWSIAEEKHI